MNNTCCDNAGNCIIGSTNCSDGDCCPDDGDTCGFCTSTSAEMTVEFDGVQLCPCSTGWQACGANYTSVTWISGDALSGKHLLTQDSFEPCKWTKSLFGVLRYTEHTTSSCTTSYYSIDIDLVIEAFKTLNDKMYLAVYGEGTGLVAGTPTTVYVLLFYKEITTDFDDCYGPFEFENDLEAADCADDPDFHWPGYPGPALDDADVAAYEGSAFLECGDTT